MYAALFGCRVPGLQTRLVFLRRMYSHPTADSAPAAMYHLESTLILIQDRFEDLSLDA